MPFKNKPSDQMKKQADELKNYFNVVPRIVGQEAENFFKQSFRAQGFSGNSFEPWKKRKKPDAGRAILVKSGKLRNSVRVLEVRNMRVVVGSDMPYAEAHNEGFKGTVNVTAHSRRNYGKMASARTSLKTRKTTTRMIRVLKGKSEVAAFTRKMNMPQRKFIGNSPYLNAKISRILKAKINQILK